MKKIWMVLMAVGLLAVGVLAVAGEVQVIPENIAQLVGKWEGTREFPTRSGGGSLPVTLVIENPLKAIITYGGGGRGGRLDGRSFPLDAEIKDGKLLLKGVIETNLSLDVTKSGMRLEGKFYFNDGTYASSGIYKFEKEK